MRATVVAAIVSAVALPLSGGAARAQLAPPAPYATSFDQPSYLTPAPLSRDNPLLPRSRDYSGIQVSDWLFYPSLLMGSVYNDNLLQTQSRTTAALGARLQGELSGVRDTGLSRTELFSGLDAYVYPDHLNDSTYDGRVGVAEVWTPQSDLVVKAQIEFDQSRFDTFGGLVETPSGVAAALVGSQTYREVQSAVAVQKSVGRYFLGVSLGETATFYGPLATTAGSISQDYRDSAVTTLSERAGYWVTPMLYTFGETSENWRQYVNDPFTSHGYRAIAGLGSDRISLFRGEVYGGFQEQFYSAAPLGAAKSPVFGGKLYWYPTRAWTVSGSINETFSDANNPTPSNPQGDPARVTAAQVKFEYQLARAWSAQGVAEFDNSRYLGVSRVDDAWSTGIAVDREIMRNLHIKIDYKWLRNQSNAVGASFVNNIVGATGLYKF